MHSALLVLALALVATARPTRRAEFDLANGKAAIKLNDSFKTLKEGDACTDPNACIGDKFAQCVNGKLQSQACAPGTQCAALPLVNSEGTSITCTTADDLAARIAATGATDTGAGDAGAGDAGAGKDAGDAGKDGAANNGDNGAAAGDNGAAAGDGDAQKSLTLDPAVIPAGFAQDGQAVQDPGQVPSLTTTNNFINFCLTTGQKLHTGEQNKDGSCNPAPMGSLPSQDKIPRSKFVFPTNQGQIKENDPFTVKMKIVNIQAGNFVNAKLNYYSAPQQLNKDGIIIGHTHFVIEAVASLKSTEPLDPLKFQFFKGINTAADADGVVSTDLTEGLPKGTYRLASINAAANHQPVLAPIAQHGSTDDMVYFEVV